MFGLSKVFGINEKVANPVGLDNAIYWLTVKIDEGDREFYADKVGGCLLLGLTAIKLQAKTPHELAKEYHIAQAEALKKHDQGEGSLADAGVAYMVMSFFIVIQYLETKNGKFNLSKILSYIASYASNEISSKLDEIL